MLDLVGIPYDDKGDSPETGFNCYSLVRYVLNTELGLDLPAQPPQAFAWARYVKVYNRPLPALQKYDVIMLDEIIPGLVNHIGVMISPSDFIHAGSKFGGVVCEPADRYRDKITAIGRPHR